MMGYLLVILVSLFTCAGQLCQKQAALTWQQAGERRRALTLRWLALALASCAAALVLGLWQLRRSLAPYRQVQKILTQDTAAESNAHSSPLQQASWQADQKLKQDYAQAQQALTRLQELDRDN